MSTPRHVPHRLALPLSLVLAATLSACAGADDGGSASEASSASTSAASTGTSGAVTSDAGTSGASATTTTTSTSASTSAGGSTSGVGSSTGAVETTGGADPCGAPPTFEEGKSPTTILHVAPGGADGPACGDEGSPCATIEGAASKATPGTAIRLHAGTHAADQYVADLHGSADAPIWIGGAPGEARPVLSGGAEALHLTRPRHVIVHDLEVQGATGNGINIDDGGDYGDPEAARFVVLRDLWVHQIGQGGNQDCVKLSGLNDYVIHDVELDHCGDGGSAIDHVGCHRGRILGSFIHDNGGNAVQCKGGSDDVEIRGNRIVDSGQRAINMGGSTGFEFFRPPLSMNAPNFEARDIRVIANTIVGSDASLAFVGCVDCLALNNTIVGPHNWILRILQETTSTPDYEFLPAGGGAFINNLVLFERGDLSTYVNIGPDTAAATFTFTTNLWYASDDPGQSSPAGDLPAPESGAVIGQDPLLVSPPGDLHLQPGSPAIAAGTAHPALAGDLEGSCYGDPPDIGAFAAP